MYPKTNESTSDHAQGVSLFVFTRPSLYTLIRFATLILLGFAVNFLECSALAQGHVDSDSDILGIKLSMTAPQSQDFVTKTYPDRHITTIPVNITADGTSVQTNAGFVFDNSPTDPMRQGIPPADVTQVLFDPNPNSHQIFGVCRWLMFGQGASGITREALLSSLTTKYGQPDVVYTENGFFPTYTWSANKAAVRALMKNCGVWNLGDPFLNESGVGQGYNVAAKAPGMLTSLMEAVSTYWDHSRIYSMPSYSGIAKCGPTLCIQMQLRQDGTVDDIYERLIDLTRGAQAFRTFTKDLDAEIQAAKSKQLDQASKNTPQL